MNEENKVIKKIKIQSTIAFILVLFIVGLIIAMIILFKSIFLPGKERLSVTESIDGNYRVEANI